MATKKNSSAKSPQATSRSNRDSMRWILGLLLLFAGLFLTASVLFYYFDWRADMSLVSGVEQEDPRLADLSDAIENPCGYAGAWLAERLVGRSFGLFGIILPLIVTMVGVRIIRQRPLLFNHSVLGALLILILGSLTLGFAFGEKWAVFGSGWGGAFGVEVARRLTSVIGVLGNIILLLGAWILTGVFINRNFINTVNTAGNAMVDKGGKIVDLVKQSVVNVTDHRSKSGEEKTDAEPEPDSKPESERSQPEPVPAPVDASARTSAADGAAEVTIQRPAPVAAPVSDEPDESPFLEIPLTEEAPATVPEPAPSRPAGPRIVGGDDVFTEVDLSGGEADAAFTAPREPEQPQYASEPAPVVDGITEYTLTAEPEIPAEDAAATAAQDKYVWPVDGAVLRPYAMTALAYDETMSDWRTHDGIDIEAKYGTVVSAMASGTVTKVYYDDLYGTTVVTEREDGLRCMYANLESIPTVNVGDQVSVGDTIGSVGDSAGCESAQESHLHLSVAASGQSVSPLDYLPQKN